MGLMITKVLTALSLNDEVFLSNALDRRLQRVIFLT